MVFAFNHYHQYVHGKKVKEEFDHKPLESTTKKPYWQHHPIYKRCCYSYSDTILRYCTNQERVTILVDTPSFAYIKGTPDSDFEEDLVCAVSLVMDNLTVSDPKLKAICDATEKDLTMTKLQDTITHSWPERKSEIPQELKGY